MKLFSKYSTTAITLCVINMVLAGNLAAENITNTVPFSYDFEGLANDESIVGTNGWYAETNTYAVATNTANPYGGTFPISTTHNTHIVLNTENSSLTNRFVDTGTSDTWVDLMLNPTRVDEYPDLSGDADVDIALFVNSNGYPVIYHLEYAYGTNRYTEIPYITIGSDTWTRVTLKYTTAPFGPNYGLFEIRFDGGAPVTNNEAFLDNGVDYPRGGTLFAEAGTGLGTKPSGLSSVAFSGTGLLDDFVITNASPVFSITWAIIASVNNALGASISPAGTNYYTQGSTQTVTITYSNLWDQTVTVDGSVTTPAPASVTFENITSSHTVTVVSAAQTLTNNVPSWWLATYGTNPSPDNAYALADDDGDGLSNWEEWLASTDPTVSNEFEIIKHYLTNGNAGVVVWVSAAVDPQLPPFNVLRTTNLMASGGGWEIAGSTNRPIGGGTNEWIDPSPPGEGVPAYYRVSATN